MKCRRTYRRNSTHLLGPVDLGRSADARRLVAPGIATANSRGDIITTESRHHNRMPFFIFARGTDSGILNLRLYAPAVTPVRRLNRRRKNVGSS
jgi:hypothetical protein